jgi:hypothetical protein
VQLSLTWVQETGGYKDWMVSTGFGIGVVSAVLCFMILVTIGITKQIFNRIRMRIPNAFLKEVLPPLIGGLVIGTLAIDHSFCFIFGYILISFFFIVRHIRYCELGPACHCG